MTTVVALSSASLMDTTDGRGACGSRFWLQLVMGTTDVDNTAPSRLYKHQRFICMPLNTNFLCVPYKCVRIDLSENSIVPGHYNTVV